MIDVKEAKSIINKHKVQLGTELVHIENCINRILAEKIKADRDFPPFNRVMMDGIAVNHANCKVGQSMQIEKTIAAGDPVYSLKDKNACVEIMTGAVLPHGCDTVIPYELLTKNEHSFTINQMVPAHKNVHPQGSDFEKETVLLKEGHCIGAAAINILASVGKESVLVNKLPKIVVISSGDELIPLGESPLPHQIRRSNSYMIQAALKARGLHCDRLHIPDVKEEIIHTFRQLYKDYDVLVMSGGVSMGKFDFIPAALEEIGIKKLFHKVKQRPGKPFWFGVDSTTTVFAFPGNPVSTLVGTYHYLLPWLENNAFLGLTQKPKVRLTEAYEFKPSLTRFLHCKINFGEDGIWEATPAPTNGSGDLASPAFSDGFIVLPADQSNFNKGELFTFYSYNKLI